MPTIIGSDFSRPWCTPVSPVRDVALDARVARTRDRARQLAGAARPPAAVAAAYRTRLLKTIAEMDNSIRYWMSSSFRKTEDDRELLSMVIDSAADDLQAAMWNLRRRWTRRFNRLADDLAAYFAKEQASRTDSELKRLLRRSGMSVRFSPTAPMREALDAIVAENVSLIRSIPEQYLGKVEQATMRSVLTGRDLAGLIRDIQDIYGVTRRRAELIARDQNNKSSAMLQRVRYDELGIERAVWRHSHAGRDKRPTHVANDGQEYSVREGWLDPAINKRIWPGTEINCRCVAIPVLP